MADVAAQRGEKTVVSVEGGGGGGGGGVWGGGGGGSSLRSFDVASSLLQQRVSK